MKFISFENKFPDEDKMVLVRFKKPYLFNTITFYYEILKSSEINYKVVTERSAVGWMYTEDLDQLSVDRNELCEGIVTFYYNENDEWKQAGEGYISTVDLALSTWEFERTIWVRETSFQIDFCEKFKDADEWPTLKIEAKMPVVRGRSLNGASLSTIYMTANNVQVTYFGGDYMMVRMLQDENGYSMEMKVE